MGLRHASVRHPNVVVMAPALTETTQPQKFKVIPRPRSSRLPLSLKRYKVKSPCNFKKEGLIENNSNGIDRIPGMNGHSPSKITYNINGLAKTLRNEFLPLEKKEVSPEKGETFEIPYVTEEARLGPDSDPTEYTLTQIGGFIMSNSGSSMGDNQEIMGLQKSNRDSQGSEPGGKEKISHGDVDQLFKHLGVVMSSEDIGSSGELGHNVEEILQVIKSMENNGGDIDSGPSGDPDPMFPMSDGTDFDRDLFNVVDVMGMCVDDNLVSLNKDTLLKDRIEDARKKEFLLKRKCEFLSRRLRKIQARAVGRQACEEITGVIEYAGHLLESNNKTKSYKTELTIESNRNNLKIENKGFSMSSMSLLMKQLEHASTQQANSIARNNGRQCKYFGSGSCLSSGQTISNGIRPGLPGSVLPPFRPDVKTEIEQVAGELQAQLTMVQSGIDSDVTASSSGCESCDEFVSYNNQYQHQLTISKRAAWRYAEERAGVASRWTWLQAQMADLDYRIRQQNEIRRQLKGGKGCLRLAGGDSIDKTSVGKDMMSEDCTGGGGGCSRTRGVVKSSFTKKKFIRLSGLHRSSKKARRAATLRCSCRAPLPPCALCTGRDHPTLPKDIFDVIPTHERIAYLDYGYHPQLSFSSDVSQSLHYDAVLKSPEWQARMSRMPGKGGGVLGGGSCSSIGGGGSLSGVGSGGLPGGSGSCSNSGGGLSGVVVGMGAAVEAAAAIDPDIQRRGMLKKNNHHYRHHHSSIPSTFRKASSSTITTSTPSISLSTNKELKRTVVKGKRRRKPSFGFDRHRQRRKSHAVHADSDGRSTLEGESTYEGDSSHLFSPVPSPTPSKDSREHQSKRKRENSYDIDNIVIPYSIAASTRPEKLHYKEILTPKWRRIKDERSENLDHKNGVVRRSSHEIEGEEDISEEAMIARHDKCEVDEKKKFLSYLKLPNSGFNRGRGQRRTDSRAESSGANTPDPMSPGNKESSCGEGFAGENVSPLGSPPATPAPPPDNVSMQQPTPVLESSTASNNIASASAGLLSQRRRTISQSKPDQPKSPPLITNQQDCNFEVPPYEPRVFPLSEELYEKMLSENEAQPQFTVIEDETTSYKHYEFERTSSQPQTPNSFSTDSADSFVLEDPNDPEWTVSETTERQQNKR